MIQQVYCARCGTLMERRLVDDRERDVCPACDFILYRNPVPAVGVVVALEGKVVLVRRRYAPQAGCWALPAGFMELGESAEEAAARECHEETGLLVRVDHLLDVYSIGAGQQTGLLLIYAATATGGELAAADDATEAGAFAADALPAPMAFPTHIEAIERWRHELGLFAAEQLQVALPGALYVRYAGRPDTAAALGLLLGAEPRIAEQQAATEALLHDRLSDPNQPVLVAELDGVVAGIALLSLHQALRGWHATLDEIAVAGELHRRGVGRALVDALAVLAKARGCELLQVVQPVVPPTTQQFLIACGFDSGIVLARRLQ